MKVRDLAFGAFIAVLGATCVLCVVLTFTANCPAYYASRAFILAAQVAVFVFAWKTFRDLDAASASDDKRADS